MKACVISTQPHLYARPQDVVLTSMLQATVAGYIRILLAASMQDPVSELLRIPLPRTPVNRPSPEMRQASWAGNISVVLRGPPRRGSAGWERRRQTCPPL